MELLNGEQGATPLTKPGASTRQVNAEEADPRLLACLLDEEEGIRSIHVQDTGSQGRRAEVKVQGYPVTGIADNGADITITMYVELH